MYRSYKKCARNKTWIQISITLSKFCNKILHDFAVVRSKKLKMDFQEEYLPPMLQSLLLHTLMPSLLHPEPAHPLLNPHYSPHLIHIIHYLTPHPLPTLNPFFTPSAAHILLFHNHTYPTALPTLDPFFSPHSCPLLVVPQAYLAHTPTHPRPLLQTSQLPTSYCFTTLLTPHPYPP